MHATAREVIVVTADKGVYDHHMAQQVSSMHAGDVYKRQASEPRGRGGASRVVSREAECSSGPDVRNSSQGAGTGVVQGSTVIPGTSRSSLGASGVYSMCLCGCVRHWCPASSRVCVFA